MKLLLDENISRRIVGALQPSYPGSSHVVAEGLQTATDGRVWQYAKENGFVVVSKDDDFAALSALHGHPPRLIKLSLGNCSNAQVVDVLLRECSAVKAAFADATIGMLELVPGRALNR